MEVAAQELSVIWAVTHWLGRAGSKGVTKVVCVSKFYQTKGFSVLTLWAWIQHRKYCTLL